MIIMKSSTSVIQVVQIILYLCMPASFTCTMYIVPHHNTMERTTTHIDMCTYDKHTKSNVLYYIHYTQQYTTYTNFPLTYYRDKYV